jgi:hypothetical protein
LWRGKSGNSGPLNGPWTNHLPVIRGADRSILRVVIHNILRGIHSLLRGKIYNRGSPIDSRGCHEARRDNPDSRVFCSDRQPYRLVL